MLITILALIVGFTIGYFSKGVTININKSEEHYEEGYNESTAHLLDPEQRQYFEQTNGLIK